MTENAKGNTRDINAAQRMSLAIQLRAQRLSYEEIAQRVGYSGRGACHNAIQRELQRVIVEDVRHLRREELDMLDRLHQLVWDQIVVPVEVVEDDEEEGEEEKGSAKPGVNLFAVDRILAISKRRCELMGLDVKPEASEGNKVVIREVPVGWIQPPKIVEEGKP